LAVGLRRRRELVGDAGHSRLYHIAKQRRPSDGYARHGWKDVIKLRSPVSHPVA
jgi:hypothetical protein